MEIVTGKLKWPPNKIFESQYGKSTSATFELPSGDEAKVYINLDDNEVPKTEKDFQAQATINELNKGDSADLIKSMKNGKPRYFVAAKPSSAQTLVGQPPATNGNGKPKLSKVMHGAYVSLRKTFADEIAMGELNEDNLVKMTISMFIQINMR